MANKTNSAELLAKKHDLQEEVRMITETCEKEIRSLSDVEEQRIAEIKYELADVEEQLRKLSEEVALPGTENKTINSSNTMSKETNFSLVRAIRNVAENRQQDEATQAVLDAGKQHFTRSKTSYNGQIQIPCESRTVTKGTEGSDVVQTDIFNIAEALHNKSIFSELGCRIISGLVGDVQFPVASTATATWETETATTSATTPTFSSVKLAPKRLSCVVPVSKMLLAQDSAGVEMALRNEITKAILGKLEATVFSDDAGTTSKPAGIFYSTTALTVVDSFADLADLEATLDGYDNFGEMKYAMSPASKAVFRGMVKGTNAGAGMVMQGGEVDGTPVAVSGFVESGDFAYGDWSNLIIGSWDGLDITVDNFTLAADGCVRLVVNYYCDAQLLRSGAIAVATTTTA